MMLLKNKQFKKRNKEEKILISSIMSQKTDVDNIPQNPEELSKQKYDDEEKYTRLHAKFESEEMEIL